jgi:hypothetical protein
MCAWSAFATGVGAWINLDFLITWENEVLWAPSSSGYVGGSIVYALCAGCHLQLHAHYFSLTACDRRVTWIQVLWTTTSWGPLEWLSDRGTLHWHRNGHLSSLPSTESEVWNRLWSTISITHKILIWTDLGLCLFPSFFPGEYCDNNLNDNFFPILN